MKFNETDTDWLALALVKAVAKATIFLQGRHDINISSPGAFANVKQQIAPAKSKIERQSNK